MAKIHDLILDIDGRCRICFHRKEMLPRHFTYRCSTKTCSTLVWKAFKKQLPFPKPSPICPFCFAPFGSPFHSPEASVERFSFKDCIFQDALKELTYIIYDDSATREAVFNRINHPMPTTLDLYKRFICRQVAGGIFGVYEVLNAYIDLRVEGEDR